MITRHDIAFMVQEIISECHSRPKGAEMIDLIDKYADKFGKDNNALVPLDFQVIFDMLFDRTQYSVDSCKDIAEEICAKFGKDNSGMVLDKKEIRRTINEIQVPYADSQTGRIALTIYIDLIVEAIYSKFSQQPPKERKVSLEEIKIIKGNSY